MKSQQKYPWYPSPSPPCRGTLDIWYSQNLPREPTAICRRRPVENFLMAVILLADPFPALAPRRIDHNIQSESARPNSADEKLSNRAIYIVWKNRQDFFSSTMPLFFLSLRIPPCR